MQLLRKNEVFCRVENLCNRMRTENIIRLDFHFLWSDKKIQICAWLTHFF